MLLRQLSSRLSVCQQVTVLEAAAAPAQGATKASWAWLNSNYKQPQHYKGSNPCKSTTEPSMSITKIKIIIQPGDVITKG